MKKRITEITGVKIAAVITSYALVIILVLSAIATGLMTYYKFYFSDEATVKEEIMTDMANNEAYHAAYLWYWTGEDLTEYYFDKNIYFEIFNTRTNETAETNYNGEEYIVKSECEFTEWIEKSCLDNEGNEVWYSEEEIVAEATIYVAKDMQKNDLFSVTLKIIELGFKLEYAVILIMLISLICLITLWCYLFCAAGHHKGGEISLNFLDRIPFDIYTAVIVAAAVFSVILVADNAYTTASTVIALFLVGSVDYFLGLIYLLSFAARIKTKTLIKNTLIYKIIRFCGKYIKKAGAWLKYIFSGLPIIYKTVILLAGILIAEFIVILIIFNSYWYWTEFAVLAIVWANLVFILATLYLAVTLQKIKQGGEKIVKGELEHKIDTTYMIGDFKAFSESLNNINDGLQNAVNEKMKSERFKTELITNVSHDIKTPLTSIVNYVDLIKKEKSENETINSYIEVLDRQSGRLKKLVEDLVEASKASTGNLSVHLVPCDVGVLLGQTAGEFEDRLQKAGISPILNIPESPVTISADGRHLWRIFDNLMNNVCKYAMPGTRVYLDVKAENGKAVITFRNISKYGLNISADELMERFVRGDSSRNTEGSGLGLSIAKSLAELQNGTMKLSVDGDLFKVTLEFPILV